MPNVFNQVELDEHPTEITETQGIKPVIHNSQEEETNPILIKEDKST